MFSAFPWLACALTFATFISPSVQDTQPSVDWHSPPGAGAAGDFGSNWVIKQGDSFKISFDTTATNFDVVIWQSGVRNPYVIKTNTSDTNFDWTVDTTYFNIPITPHGDIPGNVCYFGLTNINGHQEWLSTSHYINLTSPVLDTYYATVSAAATPPPPAATQPANPIVYSPRISTIIATPTARPTATSTADMSMVPNTSDDTSSNSNQGSSNGQLTGASAAGIGVGVALGVLILAAAVAAFLHRRRQQRRGLESIQTPQRNMSLEDPEKRTWRQMSTSSAPGPEQQAATFAHGAGGDGIRLGAGVPLGSIAMVQRHELGHRDPFEVDVRNARELPS